MPELIDIQFEQVDDRDLQSGTPDVGACAPAFFVGLALVALVIVLVLR